MKRKKVLIFASEISGYNVACFNCIAEQYDLTVSYFDKDKSSLPCKFIKKHLPSKKIGHFVMIKGARKMAKQFDVVCFPPDLHFISYWGLVFLPKHFKTIDWGIGFRVSYKHPYLVYRKHSLLDWFSKIIQNRCDASIFYMEQAKEFWKDTNFRMEKIFVAINTTDVFPISIDTEEKKEILFVGTLYKGKGLDKLLEVYSELASQVNNPPRLTIVGDGSERSKLENYVNEHKLGDFVCFKGAIYDEKQLALCFEKALLCISPYQAGLSVLKSMGYGVPFVTMKTAITGGEIYNIKNGENGIMYDKDDDLLQILLEANSNPGKYINMGIKAKEYYDNNATVKHQANSFMEAIEYSIKS